MPEYKTLEEYLQRDPLNDYDFTREIRNGLAAKGISFESMCWLDTEAVIEAAIKPLRDEISRLRVTRQSGLKDLTRTGGTDGRG